MYKINNTKLEEAQERLCLLKAQRLSVDLTTIGANLELLLTPLNDDWKTMRLVGTDSKFVCVGVINYGCYPLKLAGDLGVGYVATKLGLPYDMAEPVTNLLNDLKVNNYEK